MAHSKTHVLFTISLLMNHCIGRSYLTWKTIIMNHKREGGILYVSKLWGGGKKMSYWFRYTKLKVTDKCPCRYFMLAIRNMASEDKLIIKTWIHMYLDDGWSHRNEWNSKSKNEAKGRILKILIVRKFGE